MGKYGTSDPDNRTSPSENFARRDVTGYGVPSTPTQTTVKNVPPPVPAKALPYGVTDQQRGNVPVAPDKYPVPGIDAGPQTSGAPKVQAADDGRLLRDRRKS